MASTNAEHGKEAITSTFSPMGEVHSLLSEPVDLPFDDIPFPALHLKEQNWNSYRVYKTETEFVTVEGEAAYDALAKSGIAKPVKMIRTLKTLGNVLNNQYFQESFADISLHVPPEIPKSGLIAPPSAA